MGFRQSRLRDFFGWLLAGDPKIVNVEVRILSGLSVFCFDVMIVDKGDLENPLASPQLERDLKGFSIVWRIGFDRQLFDLFAIDGNHHFGVSTLGSRASHAEFQCVAAGPGCLLLELGFAI